VKNLSISIRLYLLVALALCVLVATLTFSLFYSYNSLADERRAGLASIDQTALAVFSKYYKMEQDGVLKREEAQAKALEVIGAMRYGKDGYLWVNDMQPVMIMHPIKPELNGKDLSQNKDPNGKHIFMEFVKTVKANKEGFVDYYWPKPGFEAPVLKFSHVVGFEPWGWIVGTGVYADDLAAMFYSNAWSFGAIIAASVIVILSCAYAVVRSVVGPIARLKSAMGRIAQEKVDTEIVDADRRDEIGGMADALIVLRDSVRDRIDMRGREAEQQQKIDAERQNNETVLRTASERDRQCRRDRCRVRQAAPRFQRRRCSPQQRHGLDQSDEQCGQRQRRRHQRGDQQSVAPHRAAGSRPRGDRRRPRRDHGCGSHRIGTRQRGPRHGRRDQEERQPLRRDRPQCGRCHGSDRKLFGAHQPDHLGDRRDRFPDQPLGPERRRRGRACRGGMRRRRSRR